MKNKKTQNKINIHTEFFLPTQDDWYPNHARNTVRIRVHEIFMNSSKTKKSFWWGRISIWGADDTGMEKDFDLSNNEQDRQEQITLILKEAHSLPNPLNKDWLRGHGFVNA